MVAVVLEVPVVRLDPELDLPRYARSGDAGVDLVAAEDMALAPGGGRGLVPTGIAVAIPRGFAGFIQPRSGLALQHGVTVLNTPGLIDADYRGELKVLLVNHGKTPYKVEPGDRIAQLVVGELVPAIVVEAEALGASVRGEGGFGSTGR